jgi:hypothetical protein
MDIVFVGSSSDSSFEPQRLPHMFINLMDLSRPAVIGITTPGNSTMFRNGKIGANQATLH